jgi:four helix bundle protein
MAQVVLITRVMAGVRRYQDLVCWHPADKLEKLVFELTETGPASRDFKFRNQIRDSSSSKTRNMAEGFGRFLPAPHANFLRIAKSSLFETHNSRLSEAVDARDDEPEPLEPWNLLVSEVSAACEDHRNPVRVGRGNHFRILDRSTRLHDCGRPGLSDHFEAVAEGKERV